MISSFQRSLQLLFKDKVVLTFSLVPIFVGLILYYFLGAWIFQDVLGQGKEFISNYISSDGLGNFLYWFIVTILSAGLFLLVNYTFVLSVSLIASPFNDLISGRIERVVRGQSTKSLPESFSLTMKRMPKVFLNEFKKLTFIGILTIIGLSLSFFPVLAPLSIIISCLLLSASFLDYSWSRHDLAFRSCFNDIRKSFISYGVSGGIFLLLFSIPLVNIFVLPYAVIYFTVLFSSKKVIDDGKFEKSAAQNT